jgi:hypothetical protein
MPSPIKSLLSTFFMSPPFASHAFEMDFDQPHFFFGAYYITVLCF